MYDFQITPDDAAPYQLTARMRDVLAWERANPGRSAQQLTEDTRLSDIYWIAHHAAKRQGLYAGTRQEFEDSCDVAMATRVLVASEDTDGDGADPTQPAP